MVKASKPKHPLGPWRVSIVDATSVLDATGAEVAQNPYKIGTDEHRLFALGLPNMARETARQNYLDELPKSRQILSRGGGVIGEYRPVAAKQIGAAQ